MNRITTILITFVIGVSLFGWALEAQTSQENLPTIEQLLEKHGE